MIQTDIEYDLCMAWHGMASLVHNKQNITVEWVREVGNRVYVCSCFCENTRVSIKLSNQQSSILTTLLNIASNGHDVTNITQNF